MYIFTYPLIQIETRYKPFYSRIFFHLLNLRFNKSVDTSEHNCPPKATKFMWSANLYISKLK